MSNSGFPFSLDAEGGLCEGVENARGDFAAARPRRPPPHALRDSQRQTAVSRRRPRPPVSFHEVTSHPGSATEGYLPACLCPQVIGKGHACVGGAPCAGGQSADRGPCRGRRGRAGRANFPEENWQRAPYDEKLGLQRASKQRSDSALNM